MEVVRAGVDAFVAGDMERVASFYHPDASITVVPEGWPEPAPVERERITDAYRLEDARIREARFFWNWDEALEAIGRSD